MPAVTTPYIVSTRASYFDGEPGDTGLARAGSLRLLRQRGHPRVELGRIRRAQQVAALIRGARDLEAVHVEGDHGMRLFSRR